MMCELEHAWPALADKVIAEMALAEKMPRLMTLVAASPLDAAVHDAFGKVHGRNCTTATDRTSPAATWPPT